MSPKLKRDLLAFAWTCVALFAWAVVLQLMARP